MLGRCFAYVLSLAILLAYRLRLVSFLTGSRLLALVPGALGIHARRSWYRATLEACGDEFTVEWMTALKSAGARVGNRVSIGTMCWIAEAELRDDVMVGARAAIQGGGHTHDIRRVDIPMNRQPGTIVRVVIGPDVWIGTGAIVLADVAPGSVVAAGAVVTKTFPERSILAGVPAEVIRDRGTRASVDA
jgi:acetyltransferase-like isoleucine patch superfamily enzyme